MLDHHRKEMHEQFFQILSAIRKSETPKPEAPTFAITTRSRVSTRDPLFMTPSKPTPANHTEGETKKEGHEGAKPSIIHNEEPSPLTIHFLPTLQVIKSALSIHNEEAEKG
nr:hypothetical protein [Tanacetum cinerariifolium]